ncbi:MAG: DUF5915 domain-containing protein [Paludibaculum sp.]
MTIRPKDELERKVLENEKYAAQILEEGNIQRLALIEDETRLVKARLSPDLKKLGPRAGKHLKAISAAFQAATLSEVRANATFPVRIGDEVVEVGQDEYFVTWEGPATLQCTEEGGTFLALDTTLTPELLQEGIARDFNRLVQDQRKAQNLQISDRITVRYQASPRIVEAVETHTEYLKGELLAESIVLESEVRDGAALTLGGND